MMELGFTSCAAVAASLCISEPASIEIQASPTYTGANIVLDGATIKSMLASDSVVKPNRSQMRRACSETSCVLYRGFCTKGGEVLCTVWYAFPRDVTLRRIEIAGLLQKVTHALGTLKLVTQGGGQLPLSRLRLDAKDGSPPTCYAREGCKT